MIQRNGAQFFESRRWPKPSTMLNSYVLLQNCEKYTWE